MENPCSLLNKDKLSIGAKLHIYKYKKGETDKEYLLKSSEKTKKQPSSLRVTDWVKENKVHRGASLLAGFNSDFLLLVKFSNYFP